MDEATQIVDMDRWNKVFSLACIAQGTWVLQPGCFEKIVEASLT
jgi:hypothetical protein